RSDGRCESSFTLGISAPCEVGQHEEQRGDYHGEYDAAAGSRLLRDHRELMRNTHDVGLGMLHVADEARSHFLGVETEEGRVAAEKRHEIETIRNLIVA